MREFGRFPTLVWIGAVALALRGNHAAIALFAYLNSCQAANLIGLYFVPLVTMAHDLGTTPAKVKTALAALRAVGLVEYDPRTDLVFMPGAAALHIGAELKPTDKRHAYVVRELAQMGDHEFRRAWLARYGAPFNLGDRFEGPSQGPSHGPSEGPSKHGEKGRGGELEKGRGGDAAPARFEVSEAEVQEAMDAFADARMQVRQARPVLGGPDRERFRGGLEALPPERRGMLRAVAVRYFEADGDRQGDRRWRTDGWPVHWFFVQAVPRFLPEVEAAERRRLAREIREREEAAREAEDARRLAAQRAEEAAIQAEHPKAAALGLRRFAEAAARLRVSEAPLRDQYAAIERALQEAAA